MKKRSLPRYHDSALRSCFFISGMAGLVYQVAWAKALGLIFGHTVYSITTVLMVFMAGLAAGSWWFGRWAERETNLVLLYARIEFLIAATGALSLAGLAGARWLYLLNYPATQSWLVPVAIRFFGTAIVLFVPTFLMGGTFPVLVSAVTCQRQDLGARVSQLYWINTLGAVAGTLLSGFLLLPAIGLRLTIDTAVVLNVVAGFVAVLACKKLESAPAVENDNGLEPRLGIAEPQHSVTVIRSRSLVLLFAIIGATAFAYEIAWTRLLSITIGSSTYAFTLMLATFLAGIVIGSAAFQRFIAGTGWVRVRTLAAAQIAIGIGSIVSLIFYGRIPTLIAFLLHLSQRSFGAILLAQFVACALAMLPVAIVFGFTFPLVIALLGESTRSRGSLVVGNGYAANTIGAIVGALVTGFWLIPRIGSFRTMAVAAVINLLVAAFLNLTTAARRIWMLGTNAACVALALFVALSQAFYNRSLQSLSVVLYSESQHHLSVEEIAATTDVVFATDGVNGSVAVTRSDNNVTLRVNGKADASSGDARTQLLLGHLGAAFHPAPHRVLVIGFGSGMTISAVARYPDVERIDCVEIEPAVQRAATFFESLNHGVLKDPRVHIIFDDARDFLLTSRERYDLIVSEPSNPWIAGVASLFTDEFYRAAQLRLNAGGIFVQWVQAYSLAPTDLRMILATFAERFPEVSMWRGEELDFLLLGTEEKLTFDFNRLRAFWLSKGIRQDFESLDVHQPEALIAYYLLPDAAVRRLADHSPLNTDDKTLLEYHAPQTLLKHSLGNDNLRLVASVRPALPPPELEKNDVDAALTSGVMTALDMGNTTNIANFFNASEFPRDSAAGLLAKGRFALAQGDLQSAESALERAARLDLESPDPERWLAIAEHRLGNEESAQLLINGVLARHPNFLPALQEQAQFAIDRSDFQTALHTELEKIDLIDDPPASEYCRLGGLMLKLTHVFAAEVALQKGLRKDPYSYACHLALGELYLETGRYLQARQMFEWLVRFFPDSDSSTFRSLAGVDLMLGDLKAAKLTLNKGRRIFENDKTLQAVNSGLRER